MEAILNNINDSKPNGSMAIRTIRKVVAENKKTLITGTLIVLGFWFLVGMVLGLLNEGGSQVGDVLFYLFCPIACAAMVSMSFNDMKNKEGRIALLMLPASPMEKYLPRFLNATVGMAVVMIMGYCALQLGSIAGVLLEYGELSNFKMSNLGFVFGEYDGLIGFLYFYDIMSVYFFGSIFWPRNSFIKTTAAIILAQIVLTTIGSMFILMLVKYDLTVEWLLSESLTLCLVSVFMGAFSILFYWLSYRRLYKSTII